MTAFTDQVLSDCPSDKAFWMCNGVVIRNIFELLNNIKAQDKTIFLYHVNADHQKNDYAKWIREVLGDTELSLHLKDIMDKDRYADIIEQRIKHLQTPK